MVARSVRETLSNFEVRRVFEREVERSIIWKVEKQKDRLFVMSVCMSMHSWMSVHGVCILSVN